MVEMPRLGARKAIDPDTLLVEQLRREDAGAAEALVDAYGSRVYRLAVRVTGNASDAEEVVQDALWTVVRKIETFRRGFGLRIVALRSWRTRPIRRSGAAAPPEVSLDDVLPPFHEAGDHVAPIDDWSPKVSDPCRQTEVRRALTDALDALPTDARTAVILRDVEGLSVAEVAAAWA